MRAYNSTRKTAATRRVPFAFGAEHPRKPAAGKGEVPTQAGRARRRVTTSSGGLQRLPPAGGLQLNGSIVELSCLDLPHVLPSLGIWSLAVRRYRRHDEG